MTLKEWLAAERVSIGEFAARIGRSAEAVRRYVAGERIPDKETMPLIAEQTNGAVLPNDFFGIEQGPTVANDANLPMDGTGTAGALSASATKSEEIIRSADRHQEGGHGGPFLPFSATSSATSAPPQLSPGSQVSSRVGEADAA